LTELEESPGLALPVHDGEGAHACAIRAVDAALVAALACSISFMRSIVNPEERGKQVHHGDHHGGRDED
jgi:hypothetical protein